MTDSLQRKPYKNMPEEIRKRLGGRPIRKPEERENVEDLPRWVKTALIMRAVDGCTYKEAAAKVGKSAASLARYAKSNAAQKWLDALEPFLSDPIAMARAYMGANALSITLERFAFLEAAIAAGDYKTGDAIAKDLQDRVGLIQKKSEGSGVVKVQIQLGGVGGLEAPVVDADWSEVDDNG